MRGPRPRLSIPTTLSVALLAACGDSNAPTDASTADRPATDVAADSPLSDLPSADACADPNRLPSDTDLGCWTCPTPPNAPTMFLGQPPGAACSVCTPHPAITMRPRGDCYACRRDDGGPPFGFC